MKNVGLNKEQQIYWLKEGKGYSSLGYDVCIKRRDTLAKELDTEDRIDKASEYTKGKRGTLKAYKEYLDLINIARIYHDETGWRSESELTPELKGLEGRRVEVVNAWGEKERFIVGKSTGFIPCHLEIKKVNSMGGSAVCGSPFKSLKVLEQVR